MPQTWKFKSENSKDRKNITVYAVDSDFSKAKYRHDGLVLNIFNTTEETNMYVTYDEFRALDLYVEKYRKETLNATLDRDNDIIKNVNANKVSYSKYIDYYNNQLNGTNESDEIQKTKEKIKNMTELFQHGAKIGSNPSRVGGKVKSRRKIKSKKNSKSHKGKSRKGKSHKGNSKKTRRKSNRRSR